MDESSIKLALPGFRFHPTEEELLNFYLKNTILGKKLHYHVIGILNIYRHDPWFLPGLAKIGEREWYFFVPRDRKHGSGGRRPNRTTEHGFWKATGSDRKIVSLSEPKRVIGLKKTLVFYKGRAPRGTKTDWVMNEYRLPPDSNIIKDKDKDIVLCKVYRKATSLKVLEQRAAKEEEEMNKTSTNVAITNPPPPPLPISMDHHHTITYSSSQHELDLVLKKEEDEEDDNEEGMLISDDNFLNDDEAAAAAAAAEEETTKSATLQLPTGMENLGLQLPKFSTQVDPFHTPLCSPWLDNWLIPYANILNL